MAPPLRPALALAVVLPFCFGYYVSYLLRTVNAVIASELVRELGLGAGDLGFLTSTYFLAFALTQLPVGVALDRFGARRVVAALLGLATVGVLLFATSHSFSLLALGRGLAGFGVSACLMGGFKAFGQAFPAERQASLTGIIMAAGASGALTASVPLEWALPRIGWRGSLLVVAAATASAALLILLAVPRRLGVPGAGLAEPGAPPAAGGSEAGQGGAGSLATLGQVLGSAPFWRLAPQAALFTGGFMALQGLWIVPWLTTVEGRTRADSAAVLLVLNGGMLAGQLAVGVAATRLQRAGLRRQSLMTGGISIALLIELLIVLGVPGPLPWFGLGFFSAAGAQVYGVATAHFPARLAGRVSTAVNQLAFLGAFSLQWGMGLALEVLQGRGVAPASAFQLVFAGLWVAQTAAVAWAAASPRPPPSRG